MSLNKNKYIFVLLLTLFSFPVFGQQGARSDDNAAATRKATVALTDLVARPSFEASEGRFHLRVWIMSVIKGMKDSEVKNAETDNDEVEMGTHHVMIEVSDSEGNSVTDAMVQVSAVSPTGKEATVDLDPMMAQYGANINFNEKGSYRIKLSVDAEGNTINTPFIYTVN